MRHSTTLAALICALPLTAAGAGAQTVLDWPLLLEARPPALVAGAGAVLGNPAGAAELEGGRAEGVVSDLETPVEMGLRAVSVAGAFALFSGWSIAVAYRHVGVGDMLRTDGPPIAGDVPKPSFEVAEDSYTLGFAVRRGPYGAGVAARLDTPAEELGGNRAWAGTGGVVYAPAFRAVAFRLAGTMEVDEDDPTFGAAIEAGTPLLMKDQLHVALAYGISSEPELGADHRIIASGRWREVAELQAGGAAASGADGLEWVPAFAGLLKLGRYRLGIVREHLPNGFGAAMHYRLSVAF